MKAAIYARYSSDLQRDASIEDQVRLCTSRIEAEGWTPVATYTDHGISGGTSLRPGYQNRHARDRDAGIAARRKELDQMNRKLDALIEAIADGFRSDGLQAKLTALESRKKALEQDLGGSPAPTPRLHPNLAGLYRRKLERLHDALADPAVRDEALGILRGLIERVVMHPNEDGFTVELVGEIANMVTLALGPQTKKAASGEAAVPDAYRRSVKVVAGACNHLCRTFMNTTQNDGRS
ncbi:MAG: hypothetical protein GEU87_14525 [Alphaproteobacteria bacterium]|nr:hypothetical protein [Alphaproteobacteria bacterium]